MVPRILGIVRDEGNELDVLQLSGLFGITDSGRELRFRIITRASIVARWRRGSSDPVIVHISTRASDRRWVVAEVPWWR